MTAASGISEAINNFVDTLDWDAVASVASNIINTIIDSLYILITETDWIAIAEKVGKALSDAFIVIDWAKAGLTVGEAFKAFFGFIATTIENIDWWQIGESVKTFLVNIDWNGVADAFFEAVGAAMGGLAAFLGGLIAEEVVSAGEYFQSKIEEAGRNVVEGILVGICEALVGIGEWIKEHIFKPFLEGFQKAFEIHSPSKVMQGLGTQIIQGLLNGLKEKWKDVTDWLSNKLQWIKDKLSGAANSVKSAFSGGGGWFGGGSQKTSRMSAAAQSVRSSFENISVLAPNVALASGGVLTRPTNALIAEAGAEAVLPLSDHKAMRMIADGIMNQYDYGRENSIGRYQETGQNDSLLRTLIQENRRQNQLLEALLDKEFDISTDKIGKAAQSYNEISKKGQENQRMYELYSL